MKQTKLFLTVIMVIAVTLIGFNACNNKQCKDKEKCEQNASCCKKGDKNCGKDSASCANEKKGKCCKEDSTKQ